jgi:hypothetical protein
MKRKIVWKEATVLWSRYYPRPSSKTLRKNQETTPDNWVSRQSNLASPEYKYHYPIHKPVQWKHFT